MTQHVRKVLIVGGGFTGLAAAIALRKIGAVVDLVEIDPNWHSYRAGISIGGAMLRAFRALGVLDEFLAVGFAGDGVDILDGDDCPVGRLETPRIAGAGVPGGGAVMRPLLARILADAAMRAGADVRIGCTYKSLLPHAEHVEVEFTDGRRAKYDLVIAADGVHSTIRDLFFCSAPKPRHLGQGTWRAVVARPAEIERTTLWVGPHFKAGLDPVSQDCMYVFLNQNRAPGESVAEEQFLPIMRNLLEHCPSRRLRKLVGTLDARSAVVFKPFEVLLVPPPWHVGRVVLIGDAAHATTPHLAASACLGVEDAIVLAQELAAASAVGEALQRFQARRWERCRMVVENSARLSEIEMEDGDLQEHARLMQTSFLALAEQI